MNKVKNLAIAGMALIALSSTSKLADGNHEVDAEQSEVAWVGKKVTGQHNGSVGIKSGNLEISNGSLTGGSFTIDMPTITSLDLEGEYLQKLNGHLKSDDFFGVETYPEAIFTITEVSTKGSNGRYAVIGDMTIKSTTKSISFEAQLVGNGANVSAIADIVIDRSEFDVRYGSGSFFDDLGDKTIYDDFTLSVNLVTK